MIEAHGHVMFASDLSGFMNQDEFQQGVHAARRANDYLMSGFTAIRDCGGNIFGVKRALDAGKNIDLIMKDGKIYKNTIK